MNDFEAVAAAIAGELQRVRLPLTTERDMQDCVETWLRANGHPDVIREYRLGGAGRIDFFEPVGVAGYGVGIEVKIKGTKRALVDQLVRYADDRAVKALVVVSMVSVVVPELLGDVPIYYVSPGRAWL